jgi:hypothetical protein
MKLKRIIYFFLALLFVNGCKEKYLPNLNLSATSFLVVEGFINCGTGPTIITLTRSTKVVDTANMVFERGATVDVLSENGTRIALSETGTGVYSIPQLTLNSSTRYCIYIKTKDGKEYQSEFSDVRKTPDIDNVIWKRKNGGVQTYLNTHDATNKTKYYQWKYNQTWEFHSKYISTLALIWDPSSTVLGVPKPRLLGAGFKDPLRPSIADSSLLICWKSDSLTSITIGSSEKLSQDVIFEQPMAFIPPNTQQLSYLYSIIVYQNALSDKAYRFFQQLKRNTEQLGTVFDAQPSDNNGNIHCLTNPSEPVIGFVEVSEAKQKRIFISAADVPDWRYVSDCSPEEMVKNEADQPRALSPLRPYISSKTMTTVAKFGNGPGGIDSVYFADSFCVDCTWTGSNKKPSYWP